MANPIAWRFTTASVASTMAAKGCQPGAIPRATSHHKPTVVADPQVPGPGRISPTPNHVATNMAQRGARVTLGRLRRRPRRLSCGHLCPPCYGFSSTSSSVSVTGDEITYFPLAHLPRSIRRQRSLQKGKSASLLVTGFLQVGQLSLSARAIATQSSPPDRSRAPR